jgi:hypothetical protein
MNDRDPVNRRRGGQRGPRPGVACVPWSFCPGPGFLANLHLAAVP